MSQPPEHPTLRRSFLRGRLASTKQAVRPPGALPEDEFLAACSRCDNCRKLCPTQIIVLGDGGYPTISFAQGECTFCGECAKACPDKALIYSPGTVAWRWRASISASCLAQHGVECRICGERCAANAIRFSPQLGGASLPRVVVTECTGCGACVATCPPHAIAIA